MTARLICIGTHHKTGTIWMRKVWRRIAADQDIPFQQINRAKRLAEVGQTGPQILVNWSSRFPQALFDHPEAVFLHIIRDPRDVLLSGLRYHRVAPVGNERFLRQEREDLNGLTYQAHLNALPDDLARLRFEMAEKHAQTVAEMLAWPVGQPRATTLRYEDLIADHDCTLLRTLLEDWAIAGLDIDAAVRAWWDLSLFGGLADQDKRSDRVAHHVASGKPAQWQSTLPRDIAEVYAKTFGDALNTLGYAKDDSWVDLCPPAAVICSA